MSRPSSHPPSRPARWSSWTISAATTARTAIRARHAHLIFLPPYSPDLNPIEQAFAKLKHMMRKAHTRDVEATWRKVGQLLDLFAPAECANYLVNSGYGSV
jgi:transposase